MIYNINVEANSKLEVFFLKSTKSLIITSALQNIILLMNNKSVIVNNGANNLFQNNLVFPIIDNKSPKSITIQNVSTGSSIIRLYTYDDGGKYMVSQAEYEALFSAYKLERR